MRSGRWLAAVRELNESSFMAGEGGIRRRGIDGAGVHLESMVEEGEAKWRMGRGDGHGHGWMAVVRRSRSHET
jgi:hypothetical protein